MHFWEPISKTLGMRKNKAQHTEPESLQSIIAELPDPRVARTHYHRLEDILIISICAMLCGATSFEDMTLFGQMKEPWLRTLLALPHGIPSHDTFNRLISASRQSVSSKRSCVGRRASATP